MLKILHSPNELMGLSNEELDELLLNEYKNPALLQHLVRSCIERLKEQHDMIMIFEEKEDTFEGLRNRLIEVLNEYK